MLSSRHTSDLDHPWMFLPKLDSGFQEDSDEPLQVYKLLICFLLLTEFHTNDFVMDFHKYVKDNHNTVFCVQTFFRRRRAVLWFPLVKSQNSVLKLAKTPRSSTEDRMRMWETFSLLHHSTFTQVNGERKKRKKQKER